MFNIVRKSIDWAGRPLTLETGKIARQADAAVLVTYGETVVLATVVAQKTVKADVDFFPLTINYQEKWYAAGKVPGGFFKREGRPTEKETLTSRLIDRPIRPLFPKGFFNETQVICTVLAHDGENDPDVPALVGASAALMVSGIPFQGPIAAARVGYANGEYMLNPTYAQLEESSLDLVVAATKDSVMMVESEAKGLSEEVMLGSVVYGHEGMQPVITLINEFADEAGKPKWDVVKADDSALENEIKKRAEADFNAAYNLQVKQERSERLDAIRKALVEALASDELPESKVMQVAKNLEKDIVRGRILSTGLRIDGRDKSTVRPIVSETEVLPRVHGSALFTRGETQALCVTTLGTSEDEQMIDALEKSGKEHFMLHYNFPPYSVGEASFLKGPGRREIGHGKLAWRALRAVLPTKADFPYTIRIVSEITESNGSSSMATVCASSLSLMDAGVPVAAPVAGIAMGLIKEGKDYIVLSDILGDEDHLGDMDFKVAGTKDGVTALQMDIKIDGITKEIMQIALAQALEGRIHILGKMAEARSTSRESLNDNAPTISTIKIHPDKIREVIGSGGKVIREIVEVSGAKVDIEDDGTIRVVSSNKASKEKAIQMIQDIVAEAEIGKIYTGKIVRIVDFGVFVNLIGKTDGLVHVSEMANERIENVHDVAKEGDMVKVKVLGIDRGKIRLSMRAVNQETGEEIPREGSEDGDEEGGRDRRPRERSDRGDRRDRGGDRRGGRNDRGGRSDRGDRGDRGSRNGDRDRNNDRNDKPRGRRRHDDDNGNNGGASDNNIGNEAENYSNENEPNGNRVDNDSSEKKKKKRFFGQF